ncbi:MAG: hypothetical protein E5X77_29910, partial [Mesorhizobium sp.]
MGPPRERQPRRGVLARRKAGVREGVSGVGRQSRDAGGTAPPSGLPGISPARGRSDVTLSFANRQRCRRGAAPKLPISPLAGEMSGRTERGAKDLGISD